MADTKTKFFQLTRMKYEDQAKWFMNGFWKDGAENEGENIWKFANKFIELDQAKKKEGNELDEFLSHKFLESLGETLTVIALREKLRKIDLDANGKMALMEYLCFKYNKTVQQAIDSPQGDNTEELNEAQGKLRAVQDALVDLQNQLEEQTKVLEVSKRAADELSKTLNDQRRAEEAVRQSEAELRSAVDDLRRQEEAYQTQITTLDSKSKDMTTSTVTRNKAAAELAQLKQENPMPLRKAKITQEASLRKVEKERKAAEQATLLAENASRAADEAKEAAHRQTQVVEAAVRDMGEKLQEAHEYLEEIKRKGGVAFGNIWWMERELKEAQKYLPKSKQK